MGSGPTDLRRHVQQLFGSGCLGGLSDAELLDRYVTGRDGRAFETLVTRHGVSGPARLPRGSPRSARGRGCVPGHVPGARPQGPESPGWGQFERLALRGCPAGREEAAVAEQNDRDRRATLRRSIPPGDRASIWEQADVAAVLHEEVDRLPESYRIPAILCYWQGLSYKLAARRLGVSEETIRGRLARSRDRLRIRLNRRGVIVPVGLLAAGEVLDLGHGHSRNGAQRPGRFGRPRVEGNGWSQRSGLGVRYCLDPRSITDDVPDPIENGCSSGCPDDGRPGRGSHAPA